MEGEDDTHVGEDVSRQTDTPSDEQVEIEVVLSETSSQDAPIDSKIRDELVAAAADTDASSSDPPATRQPQTDASKPVESNRDKTKRLANSRPCHVTPEEMIQIYDEKLSMVANEPSKVTEAILIDHALANLHSGENEDKPTTLDSTCNDEIKETGDESSKLTDVIMIDNVLANLHCIQDEDNVPAPDPISKPKSTADLLAILEGDSNSSDLPKSKIENGHDKAPTQSKNHKINLDPKVESELALKQLKEMSSAKRKAPKTLNKTLDKHQSKKPMDIKRYLITNDDIIETKPQKTAIADISSIVDEWSDDENNKVEPIMDENTISSKRIIKKKVIWDPDNPDTFKLASNAIKKKIDDKVVKKTMNRFIIRENKNNNDIEVLPLTKTPVKKKKMSEVDKLLMDEGAINMIYQLERSNNNVNVPEIDIKPNKKSMISISKERKTLLNKAKILKKTVFNVANTVNEKTFRVRKDSIKTPPKSNKDVRMSISNDTAPDESRIIRRHSSSSFSSDCLSPKPHSPTDSSSFNLSKDTSESAGWIGNESKNGDISDVKSPIKGYKRKKSINDKLHAKKFSPDLGESVSLVNTQHTHTQLSVQCVNQVIHLNINTSTELYDLKTLEELTVVLTNIDREKNNTILLTSKSGSICKGLDLRSILHTRVNMQKFHATQFTNQMRELIVQLCQFKGPIIMGVNGQLSGFGVSLLSLADQVIASECASFCLAPKSRQNLPPEGLSLLNSQQHISPQLIKRMMYQNQILTASEALSCGFVTSVLPVETFSKDLLKIAKDISEYPKQAFETTKAIMQYNILQSVDELLQKECSLLMKYWCSSEGQEAIRESCS